jgi:hypothetical protein
MTQGEPIRTSRASEARCRILAEALCRILKNGITLNKETLHFIDSTFSGPGLDALKDILSDETNGEAETLLALIFFPDAALQMQLEALLETTVFEPADEARVLTQLSEMLPEVLVRFPDRPETFFLPMPRWVGDQLVSRLNISKRVNPDLLTAVDRHVPEILRLRTKVALRNARFVETENRISFLTAFFQKVKDHDAACLGFVLSLFEEHNDEPDIYEVLVSRKRLCFRSLQKAQKFLKMLQTDNVETLMLRGIRIPHVDQQDMKAQMRMIDRICLAIYGKTEYFRPPEEVLGVGGYDPG